MLIQVNAKSIPFFLSVLIYLLLLRTVVRSGTNVCYANSLIYARESLGIANP